MVITYCYEHDLHALCRPAGWDSPSKTSILTENLPKELAEADVSYFSTILPHGTRGARSAQLAALRETETAAEDEQVFLMRQQAVIQRGGPVGQADISTAKVRACLV